MRKGHPVWRGEALQKEGVGGRHAGVGGDEVGWEGGTCLGW